METTNLDAKCAECGAKLGDSGDRPKETENRITKALGVLEAQGVYALFLYLFAREDGLLTSDLISFLIELGMVSKKDSQGAKDSSRLNQRTTEAEQKAILRLIQGLADRDTPDDLLVARELLQQTLIYARYHAKARHPGERA